MREYLMDISGSLRKGMRPTTEASKNSPWLEDVFGLKVTEFGLHAPEVCLSMVSEAEMLEAGAGMRSQLFSGALDNPFMMVLPEGVGYRVLPKRIDLGTHAYYDMPFTVAETHLTDPVDCQVLYDGNYFDFVDYENAWFLNCGTCLGFRTPLHGSPLMTVRLWANSMCSWNGRLVLGGLHGDRLYDEAFLAAFQEAVSLAPVDSVLYETTVPGEEVLFWSTVRGGGITRSFEGELTLFGVPSSPDEEMVLTYQNLLRRGEIGFWKIPGGQAIKAVRQLGGRLVVFGSESVYLVGLESEGDRQVMIGHPITDFGVSGSRNISGDTGHLVVPDASGRGWRFTPDAPPELLDYREVFTQVLLAIYDERTATHYLTDGDLQAWQLTAHGMSRTRRLVTGLVWEGTDLYGLQSESTNGPSNEVEVPGVGFQYRFMTGVIDLGNQQLKTIRSVQVSGADADYWQVRVYARYSMGGIWEDTGWVDATEEGVAMLSIAGLEFKVVVRGVTSYESYSVRIDRCVIRWQQSDKRFVRGAYATQVGAD